MQRRCHSMSGFTLPVGTTGVPPSLTPPSVSGSLCCPSRNCTNTSRQLRLRQRARNFNFFKGGTPIKIKNNFRKNFSGNFCSFSKTTYSKNQNFLRGAPIKKKGTTCEKFSGQKIFRYLYKNKSKYNYPTIFIYL